MRVNKEQLDAMVNRFLGWKLPEHFSPDAGISFKPLKPYAGDELGNSWWPIGTNLLDADQARTMLVYVLNAVAVCPTCQGFGGVKDDGLFRRTVTCGTCGGARVIPFDAASSAAAGVDSSDEGQRRLMKFYGVDSLAALVEAQAYHIEKLQAKLPQTPSLAPQRVREG